MEYITFIALISKYIEMLGNWKYLVFAIIIIQLVLMFLLPFYIIAIYANIKKLNRTLKKIEKNSKK